MNYVLKSTHIHRSQYFIRLDTDFFFVPISYDIAINHSGEAYEK